MPVYFTLSVSRRTGPRRHRFFRIRTIPFTTLLFRLRDIVGARKSADDGKKANSFIFDIWST